MDLSEAEKKALADLARETKQAKTWWTANREEAIAIACTSLAVGLMLGALIGHAMR